LPGTGFELLLSASKTARIRAVSNQCQAIFTFLLAFLVERAVGYVTRTLRGFKLAIPFFFLIPFNGSRDFKCSYFSNLKLRQIGHTQKDI
jgi:hypothetical protein